MTYVCVIRGGGIPGRKEESGVGFSNRNNPIHDYYAEASHRTKGGSSELGGHKTRRDRENIPCLIGWAWMVFLTESASARKKVQENFRGPLRKRTASALNGWKKEDENSHHYGET